MLCSGWRPRPLSVLTSSIPRRRYRRRDTTELRRSLALPLDDIVAAMRRCRNPNCRAAAFTAACSGTI